MRKVLLGLFAVVMLTATASALPLELALVVDESGSIGLANFTTQMNAYHTALDAVIPAHFGDIALDLWTFDSSPKHITVGGPVIIGDQTDLDAFTALVVGEIANYDGGGTDIGAAITAAAASLVAPGPGPGGDRLVIDVSTDGFGGDPAGASIAALAGGIDQVNGLGIGAGANLSWVQPGSFAITAATFADLEDALIRKIGREINPDVPEPGTFALLGLGLVGLGVIRRRRRVA